MRQNFFNIGPGHIESRFNGGINTSLMGFGKKRRHEVRLEHTFSSADRNPSTGFTVKTAVLFYFIQNLIDCHPLAKFKKSIGRANGYAFPAIGAEVPVN